MDWLMQWTFFSYIAFHFYNFLWFLKRWDEYWQLLSYYFLCCITNKSVIIQQGEIMFQNNQWHKIAKAKEGRH